MSMVSFIADRSERAASSRRLVGLSIFTQADSKDELHTMVRDAVRCHFDEAERPKFIRLHFVRDEVIAAE